MRKVFSGKGELSPIFLTQNQVKLEIKDVGGINKEDGEQVAGRATEREELRPALKAHDPQGSVL